jgi:hypothetical protein
MSTYSVGAAGALQWCGVGALSTPRRRFVDLFNGKDPAGVP